jgi:uncharacterized protein (DUF427 family)
MWKYTGQHRPPFAEEPGPGQESVWDYPRPPALERCEQEILVGDPAAPLALTSTALRLLETASPPTYYLPPDGIDMRKLVQTDDVSYCEWKGRATYWALSDDPRSGAIGWSYEDSRKPFTDLAGYLSFYPGRIACFIDRERVRPQPGGFYGGWLTSRIVGPVKGEPGTGGW